LTTPPQLGMLSAAVGPSGESVMLNEQA